MGEKTDFGYFASPQTGKGPAVVVIQEWWGLVPHIEDVVNRFANDGFVAVAPDLFHGVTTKSPDEATKLLMELDAERAVKEIIAAGEYLLSRPECSSTKFGVVGFCMGGALAKYAATKSDKVGAAVSFYGGFKKVQPEWEKLNAPLMLIAGAEDKGVPAEGEAELQKKLQAMGKDVSLHVYPGANHAFFNDTRPEVYNAEASADAWRKTLDLFRKNL